MHANESTHTLKMMQKKHDCLNEACRPVLLPVRVPLLAPPGGPNQPCHLRLPIYLHYAFTWRPCTARGVRARRTAGPSSSCCCCCRSSAPPRLSAPCCCCCPPATHGRRVAATPAAPPPRPPTCPWSAGCGVVAVSGVTVAARASGTDAGAARSALLLRPPCCPSCGRARPCSACAMMMMRRLLMAWAAGRRRGCRDPRSGPCPLACAGRTRCSCCRLAGGTHHSPGAAARPALRAAC